MASCSRLCIFTLLLTLNLSYCSIFNGYEVREFYGDTLSIQNELVYWSMDSVTGVTNKYSMCNTVPFAAGYGVMEPNNGVASRIFDQLPTHNEIHFSIHFRFMDYWNGTDYLSLKFDSVELEFRDFVTDSTDFIPSDCAEVNRRGFQMLLIGKVPHSGPNISLQIITHLNGPPTEKSFGFREISLLFVNVNTVPTKEMCAYPTILLLNNLICQCATYSPVRYLASDGSCQLCDPSCRTCFGPTASDCYQCQPGYYFDGTKCAFCNPECGICDKEGPQGCLFCYPPKVAFEGVCIDQCGPLSISGAPFLHCEYQCSTNQYLYSDGSCHNTCPFPMKKVIKYGNKNFCESPCLTTETLYYDGSCAGPCTYPLTLKDYGSYEVCELPCNLGESLFDDGLCHVTSLCEPPFVKSMSGFVALCTGSCTSPLFLAWDTTCKSNCPVPFISQSVGTIKVCRLPNCGVNACQVCNFDSECPKNYYCYKTTAEGICMSYITYTLDSQLIKTILNGYLIRVEVTPLEGIPDSADYSTLIVKSLSLQENNDYESSVQVVSKGVFLVTLTLLDSIEMDPLRIHFVYSPLNLNLQAQIYLPLFVYISPAIQKAAEIAKTGSYVSFGILTVNIIGYAMTGGLSALWAFLPENQYCYYLLYLNVAYPYHSKLYFRSLSNYNLLMSPDSTSLENIDKEIKRSLPERFVDEDYSIDFIQNSGQTVGLIFGILAALLFVTLLFKALALPRRSYLIHRLLKTIRRILKWNGLVRQLLAYSLPLTLASFVQFHVSIFGRNSSYLATNLAGVIFIAIVMGFKKTFEIIKHIPSENFERMVYSEWYGTLWEGLDLNSNTKYYYWLTAMRGVVLAYVSVLFEVYPFFQIMILIFYQCAILSLFIKNYRLFYIFQNKNLNIVTFVEEILILLMKLAIVGFIMMGTVSKNQEAIVIIGWVIIAPGIMNQAIQSIYSICSQIAERKKIVSKIKEAVKDLCKKKPRPKTKIKRTMTRTIKVKSTRALQESDLEIVEEI